MAWFFGAKAKARRERVGEIQADRRMREEIEEQAYEEAEQRELAQMRMAKRHRAQLERQAADIKQSEAIGEQRAETGAFRFTPYTKKTFANLFRWILIIGIIVLAYFFFTSAAFGAIRQKASSSISVSFEKAGITDALTQAWYTIKDPTALKDALYRKLYETYSVTAVKTAKGAEMRGVQLVQPFKTLRWYHEGDPVLADAEVKIDGLDKGLGEITVTFSCADEDGINGTIDQVSSSSMEGITREGDRAIVIVPEEARRELSVRCSYQKGFQLEDYLDIGTKKLYLEWSLDNAPIITELHVYNIARKEADLVVPEKEFTWCIAGCGFVDLHLDTLQMPLITQEYEDVLFPLKILFEKKGGWTGEIKELKELRIIPLPKVKGGSSHIEVKKCTDFENGVLTGSDSFLQHVNNEGWKEGQYFECDFGFTAHREHMDYDIIRAIARYRLGGRFTGEVELKNATTLATNATHS